MLASDEVSGSNHAVAIALLVTVYLLPSLLAMLRGHRNLASIVVVNVLLGWTLLDWALSLAWSVAAAPQVRVLDVTERRRRRERAERQDDDEVYRPRRSLRR